MTKFILNHVLAMLLLSTLTVGAQPLQGEEVKKQLIEELNKQYFTALVENDIATFTKQFTDDCWIMVPGLPIHCGPEAPKDYFKEVLLPKAISSGKFITIDLYGVDKDMMAEVGFYQFYNKAGEQTDDGKYIVIWKEANGEWKRLRETLISSNDQ